MYITKGRARQANRFTFWSQDQGADGLISDELILVCLLDQMNKFEDKPLTKLDLENVPDDDSFNWVHRVRMLVRVLSDFQSSDTCRILEPGIGGDPANIVLFSTACTLLGSDCPYVEYIGLDIKDYSKGFIDRAKSLDRKINLHYVEADMNEYEYGICFDFVVFRNPFVGRSAKEEKIPGEFANSEVERMANNFDHFIKEKMPDLLKPSGVVIMDCDSVNEAEHASNLIKEGGRLFQPQKDYEKEPSRLAVASKAEEQLETIAQFSISDAAAIDERSGPSI